LTYFPLAMNLQPQHLRIILLNTIRILPLFLLVLPCYACENSQLNSPHQLPNELGKSDWQSIRAAHDAWKHEFRLVGGQWQANNPSQRWTTIFEGRGFLTQPKDAEWTWGLELMSYGIGSSQVTFSGNPEIKAAGQRLSYHWNGGLEEWFVNDARGLEHGFIVSERPEGADSSGPLLFTLKTLGGLCPVVATDAKCVHFRDGAGAPVLNYSGLKVWDAEGLILNSWFEQGNDGQFRIAVDETKALYPITIDPIAQQAYLKASNNGGETNDVFGACVAVSGDTVVIGAPYEDSSSTGVNSTPNENASDSGAAYVFVRNGTSWSQQAYLKTNSTLINLAFGYSVAVSGDTIVVGCNFENSNIPDDVGRVYVFVRSGTTWSQQTFLIANNTNANDAFGYSVAVSGDTAVIGAPYEDSSTTGVNSTPNESANNAGAAYVYVRSGTNWSQQAYLKSNNTGEGDTFGVSVAMSGDTVVVGARLEDSITTGVNSTPNEAKNDAGAAYVFVRSGTNWSQQAYLKASNTGTSYYFGNSVAVSGNTVVIGAPSEASSTTGVNSTPNVGANSSGAAYIFVRSGNLWSQQAYLKASNTGAVDYFGNSVAVSGDLVVIGAGGEDSSTTGVNSTPNEGASNSGAAYVFVRSGTTWSQQAYLKASNTGASDHFGNPVAVSGNTVVIGAGGEDSSTTGVNSTPNEGASSSGAAYIFVRSGTTWSQQAFCKASNTPSGLAAGDAFGYSVSVSGDTVVIGAIGEDSSTTGVNSTSNESSDAAGAAYVFVRSDGIWSQQAYLKASNTGTADQFGWSVAVSGDTVVIGALGEDSSTTGVNSTPNEGAPDSGAAYVFVRNGASWSQQAYIKASNTGAIDQFGYSVAVSGNTVVIGASGEDSSTSGVNSTPNEDATGSGATYVFVRSGTTWSQQAYLKASNTEAVDLFGFSVAVSEDTVVIGAPYEDSSATGVDSTPDELALSSGAAYVFQRSGAIWSQQAYLKASNTGLNDNFGDSVAVSGDTLVIGAPAESSSTTGINSSPNEGASRSGAAYVFARSGTIWSQQAYLKASNTGANDNFGDSVAVSGGTVVIGAPGEDSSATGWNSMPNEEAFSSGATYVFMRSGMIWSQKVYLKASNTGVDDLFGISVSVSGDTLAVGARAEDSGTPGVNSIPNEKANNSGAAYIFNGLIPADIALEAPSGSSVSSGSSSYAFGVHPSDQMQDVTFTLQNVGGVDLNGIIPTITGTDATSFSLPTLPPATLASGGSATFTVRFTATSGSKTATLSFASDDPDENPFTLILTGTGNTAPTFTGFRMAATRETATTISDANLLSSAADADGDVLSVIAAGPNSAQGGIASHQGGAILYTPPNNFSGTDSFSVTIADPHGATTAGTVTVVVSPTPANSLLNAQLTMLPGGHVGIAFQSVMGRQYQVQRSINLSNWTTIATVTAIYNGAMSYTDTSPPSGSAFYRLMTP
jgi:Cadherin-like domain/FG-GAP repeat